VRYVERGGDAVFRGPFLQSGTDYRAFVLRADRDRLAALAHRTFTAPTGGAVTVRPLGDEVLLSYADIARITSLEPAHARIGGMRELDVALWVPAEVEHAGERFVAWFIPYIFVDQAAAVATGREHYGFPKVQAEIQRDAAGLRVDAMVIGRQGPDAAAALGRVLTARPDGAAPGRLEQLAVLGKLVGASLTDATRLTSLFSADLPVLFLRQLRDVVDPRRAAWLEVLVANTHTRAVRSATLSDQGWVIELPHTDSHPVAADLGLPARARALAAFTMDFDFEMGLGRTFYAGSSVGSAGVSSTGAPTRRKVAVLGGGLGSLSAAFEITEQPGWEDRYELTVYQMGWRLGGKGASGRNADACQRIEEHGLHIWFGFYENAFRLARRLFAAAGRPPGTPLATWKDAFHPHSHFVVQECVNGDWVPWATEYPTNDRVPGDDAPELTPAELAAHLVRWADALIDDAARLGRAAGGSRLDQVVGAAVVTALRLVHTLTREALETPDADRGRVSGRLGAARRRLLRLVEAEVERDVTLRRTWIGLDWVFTKLHGLIRDGVLERGFDAINDWDYQEWLRRHGASEMTVTCAPVRAGYDLVFGFAEGDTNRPSFAAGVGLYGLLRLFFTYKGAVAYKMQAGMGDVVFTPLFEVLRARGVKFAFFHKVEELRLTPDGARIGEIAVARQATVRGEYQPLVDVKGIGCWPDRPLHDQLVEGDTLRERAIDLESSWNGWAPVERLTLRQGVDFDDVILGIPVGALRRVCAPLVAARPAWRAMVDNVTTACTHAFQLWTTPDLAGLGWVNPPGVAEPPILGAYVEPTDTWADMTHLVPVEDWPAARTPGHIAYFCGPLPDPAAYPDFSDSGFSAHERARAIAQARQFLDQDVHRLWPAAVDATGRFRGDLLVDPEGRPPEARFERQLFKGNVEPTDRYTQSRPGSLRHRLSAGGSGFPNLFLAGDWVDNGFNGGCVEATVMSGMQCARALTGADIRVHAEPARLRPPGQAGRSKWRDVVG
jgi:uncharacterized protein with NAD-binding domain and iron-sulfur cluster